MSTPRRSRRPERPTGDERERAVVSTLDGLLRTRPLVAIAIDEIAAGAGLSRSAFYFYFPSKQAVLLELLDRMLAEVDAGLERLGGPEDDPGGWWRRLVRVSVDVFAAHPGMAAALDEARATVPEAREAWNRRTAAWIDLSAAAIVAERRRGRAREVVDPRATSTALTAMNERVLVASFAADRPSVPPADLLDVLADIWCTTIYGTPQPRP
jgi:AcrR family transcriptional regulator